MIESKREPAWWSFPAGKPETASVLSSGAPPKLLSLFNRLPLFWRLQLGCWSLFEFITIPNRMWFYGSLPKALFITAVRLPLAICLSTGLRWLYHRLRLTGENPWRLGVWALGTSIVLALIEQALMRALQPVAVQGDFA